jgi:hypothetical protein
MRLESAFSVAALVAACGESSGGAMGATDPEGTGGYEGGRLSDAAQTVSGTGGSAARDASGTGARPAVLDAAQPGLRDARSAGDAADVAVMTDGSTATCRFDYTVQQPAVAEAMCEVDVASLEPCLDAARCLCANGAAPNGPTDDVEGCAQSWTAPRGAITFADYCSWSLQPSTRSLAEAVAGFASTYDATVVSSVECDDIPAVMQR